MTDKYQNTYRIASTRLQHWDYGRNAAYFVTLCTRNRACYFGDIAETPKLGVPTMQLSEIGKIAQQNWYEIPNHFPFVTWDAFVVMPNHIHGIIMIDKPDNERNGGNRDERIVETPNLGVSTLALPNPTTGGKNEKWKSGTLGVIINQYKRICTIHARQIHAGFAWQPRFYDHIIRNNESLERIRTYIIENPLKWDGDKFYNKSFPGL